MGGYDELPRLRRRVGNGVTALVPLTDRLDPPRASSRDGTAGRRQAETRQRLARALGRRGHARIVRGKLDRRCCRRGETQTAP